MEVHMKFEDVYSIKSVFKNLDCKEPIIESHGGYIEKTKRFCLFCGETYPNVSFSKVAHAVSESIGNKRLVSCFECDSCNSAFGSTFEDSFGKYVLPYKYVSKAFGKKNTITIKDMPSKEAALTYGSYRLESRKGSGAIDENGYPQNYLIEGAGSSIFHEIDGGFSLNIPRQPYNPKFVYAALLKMAFSILPLCEYPNYIKGMLCLHAYATQTEPFNNEDEAEKYISSLPNNGFLGFCPGDNPLQGVAAYLYQKNANVPEEYPKFLFRLDFYNFIFQIPVLSDEEHGNFKLSFPNIKGINSIHILDFSQEEKSFYCEFSGQKQVISLSELERLTDRLREKNLLKTDFDS